MRTLWYAAWTGLILCFVALLGFWGAATVLQNNADGGIDEPLAGLGFLMFIPIIASAALLCFLDDKGVPKKSAKLSKEQRVRLKECEQQILFDAEVARMERENDIG